MKLNAVKFGIASSISAAVLWTICTLLVMMMPTMMLSMSGDMLHMQLQEMGWHMTLAGALLGMVSWVVLAGVAGWLLATIYNRLLG